VAGFPTVEYGNAILRLKPWEERSRKQQDIARELNQKFATLPGVIGFAVNRRRSASRRASCRSST